MPQSRFRFADNGRWRHGWLPLSQPAPGRGASMAYWSSPSYGAFVSCWLVHNKIYRARPFVQKSVQCSVPRLSTQTASVTGNPGQQLCSAGYEAHGSHATLLGKNTIIRKYRKLGTRDRADRPCFTSIVVHQTVSEIIRNSLRPPGQNRIGTTISRCRLFLAQHLFAP